MLLLMSGVYPLAHEVHEYLYEYHNEHQEIIGQKKKEGESVREKSDREKKSGTM